MLGHADKYGKMHQNKPLQCSAHTGSFEPATTHLAFVLEEKPPETDQCGDQQSGKHRIKQTNKKPSFAMCKQAAATPSTPTAGMLILRQPCRCRDIQVGTHNAHFSVFFRLRDLHYHHASAGGWFEQVHREGRDVL